MIIDCISDLHGFYPELEGGDILLVSGDLTAHDLHRQYIPFMDWIKRQDYKHKVYIAGNHDGCLEDGWSIPTSDGVIYLRDNCCEIQGLKIWGSPWTPRFCDWHFMKADTPNGLGQVYKEIPNDIDILMTHGPPKGILDRTWVDSKSAGSKELLKAINRIRPKLHVFGHIHEGYGQKVVGYGQKVADNTTFVNCSHVDFYYEPKNKAIRVEM